MKYFFALLLILSSTAYLHARELQTTSEPATRIDVDQEAGNIRFFINGKEAARLNEEGLFVRGKISYGGVLHDRGSSAFFHDDGAKPSSEGQSQ